MKPYGSFLGVPLQRLEQLHSSYTPNQEAVCTLCMFAATRGWLPLSHSLFLSLGVTVQVVILRIWEL